MRSRTQIVGAGLLGFLSGYLVSGVIVGRHFWGRIEDEIDPEVFRQIVLLIGRQVGIEPITSLDSHLDAVGYVARYLTFPWQLMFGLLTSIGCILILVWIRKSRSN